MKVKQVESKQNSFYKQLLKLKTKKGRIQSKSYLIDGLRIVNHAIENGFELINLIMSQSFYDAYGYEEFKKAVETIFVFPDSLFKTLVETDSPQGIVGVLKMTQPVLKEGRILFLDEIQDPGNIGTLIRTADAAGFSSVVLKKGCTDPYSQKALRSSMGSIMSIPIIMNQDASMLKTLEGYTIYGAALEGGKPYKEFDYAKKAVLVIGNEGNGISKEVLELCDEKTYIPMIGEVESLNASIAGGILMFEIQSTCE